MTGEQCGQEPCRRCGGTGVEPPKRKGGKPKGMTEVKPEDVIELRGQGLEIKVIAAMMGISRRSVYRYLAASKGAKNV